MNTQNGIVINSLPVLCMSYFSEKSQSQRHHKHFLVQTSIPTNKLEHPFYFSLLSHEDFTISAKGETPKDFL